MNTGAILTVMRDRGIEYDSNERIRDTLNGMAGSSRRELQTALDAIRHGSEKDAELELLACLARCTRISAVSTIERCGVKYTGATAYQWLVDDPMASETLAKATSGDPVAERAVRSKLSTERLQSEETASGESPRREGQEEGVDEDPDDEPAEARFKGARKHKVFGTKSALHFELDQVRGPDEDVRRHTMRVEAAKKVSGEEKRFDWDNKIIFQFTRQELALVAAALLGWLPRMRFTRPKTDKWCEFEVQPGKLFVKVAQGRRVMAVPIEGSDLYEIALIGQRALALNDPDVAPSTIFETLKQISALARTAESKDQDDSRSQ